MKRYYISNEKINVHITEWGNNDKPVIFCLHGLGSTSLSFIEIAEELKEKSIDLSPLMHLDMVKHRPLKERKIMRCTI